MLSSDLKTFLNEITGKSIAIVYTFINEDLKGFGHYDYWKSPVLSDWMRAIESLNCIPYICDVRTFCSKALESSLPKLDYVINLNAGNCTLEGLALVQSICGVCGIKYLPNSLSQTVVGEHKHYSNLISQALGLNIPSYVEREDNIILRPISMGSSVGIAKEGSCGDRIKQEFIKGYDITTPIIYDPFSDRLVVTSSVYYMPDSKSPEWFFSAENKSNEAGYERKLVELSAKSEELALRVAVEFGIRDYCRIDWRFAADDYETFMRKTESPLNSEELYFLEINAMPTITEGYNFLIGLQPYLDKSEFYKTFNQCIPQSSAITYVLCISLIACKQSYNQAQ